MSEFKYRTMEEQEQIFDILLDEESPLTRQQIARLHDTKVELLTVSLIEQMLGYTVGDFEFEDESEVEQVALSAIYLTEKLQWLGIHLMLVRELKSFQTHMEEVEAALNKVARDSEGIDLLDTVEVETVSKMTDYQ